MKENNYVVIQSFMCNDLELKGNELLVYALIHGFSQDGMSWYTGSANYIAKTFNISRRTVARTLAILVERGLLIKKDKVINGAKLCDYKSSNKRHTMCQNDTGGYDKMTQGVCQNDTGGCDKMTHHNTRKIILEDNTRKINKETVDSLINSSPEELQETLKDFKEMRTKLKSPLTVKALKLLISKTNKLANGDVDTMREILEQSIMQGWKGVFPLKNQKQSNDFSFLDL